MASTGKRQYSVSMIRSQTWAGSIPVILSLAPTSLSSSTMPPSQHRLISRMSYLHVGLREDILRLYKYAPALTILSGKANTSLASTAAINESFNRSNSKTGDNDENEKSEGQDGKKIEEKTQSTSTTKEKLCDHPEIPICWFEDEVTGKALRWQLFAGVLYDLLKYHHISNKHGPTSQNINDSALDESPNPLPWKIRVHFTSYPEHILSLEQYISTSNNQDKTLRPDFYIPKSVPIFEFIQNSYVFTHARTYLFLVMKM